MTINSELRVRPIEPQDLASVIDILIAGSLNPEVEDPSRPEDYWRAVEDVRSRDGEVFVAEYEGQPVGVCQVVIFRNIGNAGRRVAEIENVHVREAFRSQGIGEQMIRACEELAATRDCHRVQLTSNVSRTDAHRFYERIGYSASHKGFKKSLRR